MKSKIKIDKIIRRFFLMLILAISVCLMCLNGAKMTVLADEQEQVFNIDAQMLPSATTFDIILTIENIGEDWEGTARLMMGGKHGIFDCAYDTEISLSQGSTKQFVVRVPKESANSANGEVQVTLLDRNSDVAADKVINCGAVILGILSDDYSALTYLDIGGHEFPYYTDDYPIRLMELNQDNLIDSLDSLNFLVIDRYNTGVLTDDEISDIDKWVNDGGVLIIGTGSYVWDTLSGFGYLGIECSKVYSPGETTYSGFRDVVDWSRLHMAEFTNSGILDDNKYENHALTGSQGEGAVGVLQYSLSEFGSVDFSDYYIGLSAQRVLVHDILYSVNSNAHRRAKGLYYYDNDSAYAHLRMLRAFGKSGNILKFGVLRFIIIVYVIITGPILYMILRYIKKRELYWAAVPVAAFVGVLLVFFAGRGLEVVNTRVYSVTSYNLSERGDCKTYIHCYDAGHREWSLRLEEGYEYAGSYISYNLDYDPYYYHIRKDGDRLFFGIKPSSGFEESYFCAVRAADAWETEGNIESTILMDNQSVFTGTVTNNTNYDFAYFAVLADGYDYVQVYKNLPAGETSSLTNNELLFTVKPSGYYGDYNYMSKADECVKVENMDDIAALGVGIGSAVQQLNAGEIVIVGVVPDWDKAVDDNCSEVSYGCFYMIQ